MIKKRPVLENLINDNMSPLELFQNKTLRPVIKMQHDLLIASFKNYILKRKIDLSSLTEPKKRNKTKAAFVKDINYKNLTLGFIIGCFSGEEYDFYNLHASELNKRILQIVIQRVQDSLPEILA